MPYRIHNRILHAKIRNFVDDAFPIVEEYVRIGSSERGQATNIVLPIVRDAIAQVLPRLRLLKSFAESMQALSADTVVSRHLNKTLWVGFHGAEIDPERCLITLLVNICAESIAHREPPSSFFNHEYNDMEHFFYSELLEERCFATVRNFTATFDHMKLGHFQLRKIQDADRIILNQLSLEQSPFFEPTHLVEKNVRYKKVIINHGDLAPSEEDRDLFGDFITSLRLLKGGRVDVSQWTLFEPLYWLDRGTFHGMGDIGGYSLLSNGYALDRDEEARLRSIIMMLTQSKPFFTGSLGVALRRFNSANYRLKDEDRLLDLIIAMEALLLRGAEQNELGYRLALRGAALFSENGTRKEVFTNLKSAYDLRSLIVHGEREARIHRLLKRLKNKSGADVSLNEFTELIEDTTRTLIRDYARLRKTVASDEELIAKLDEKILKKLS
jgi:hypothetical protein